VELNEAKTDLVLFAGTSRTQWTDLTLDYDAGTFRDQTYTGLTIRRLEPEKKLILCVFSDFGELE